MARVYSLKKSRGILHSGYKQFQKKGKNLSPSLQKQMELDLRGLEEAVFSGDREGADRLGRRLEEFSHAHFKKSILFYGFEIVVALLFALLIAAVVRQMWFELYEIPSGSMRPSFREQDRLTVTKTAFGLNVPLQTKHFYFDPSLIERAGVVIFSGDGIPMLDAKTNYFGIIPYTKRYIKRMIGKPGDMLYFYGGFIYGIDKDGKPINELLEDPWMKKVEHIPFITFEGNPTSNGKGQITFSSMSYPIGKLVYNRIGASDGEVFVNDKWVKEKPFDKSDPRSYSDFWGIGNFAMARLMNKAELEEFTAFKAEKVGEGVLYLHIKHTPNLTYPIPRLYKDGGNFGVQLPTMESVIPLTKEHLDAIMDHMYTSRFVIKGGRAKGYSVDDSRFQAGNPLFKDVQDGTYEFYHGKAEQVGWQGTISELPKDHPFNKRNPEHIKEMFNLGIDMLTSYDPYTFFQVTFPHRYAYFRDGDFYLLGAPVIRKEDPALKKFVADEASKEANSSASKPYKAFIDRGPPMKDGTIDVNFIKKYGVKVPEKHYLVLGDNHAMSLDSRFFGFVPENNIQGAPSLILWPFGDRWGLPPQSGYPFITVPRLIVWAIAAAIFAVWYALHRRKMNKRLFK